MSIKTAFCFFLIVTCALSQVLATASTVGKGTEVVIASENHLFVDGVNLNVGYAQYVRGITKTFDLYASVGSTNFGGENQEWVGVGGNLHLFQAAKFDVSLFSVASVPVNRRKEASTVLLNSAVVISREVSKTVTLYSGTNGLFPIGAKERGFSRRPPGRSIFLLASPSLTENGPSSSKETSAVTSTPSGSASPTHRSGAGRSQFSGRASKPRPFFIFN